MPSGEGEGSGLPGALARFVARFDRGEYWLAHEELEELWRRDRSDFYKGLIQLAAAFVHIDRGNWNGARKLLRTALGYLAPYPPSHRGLDVEAVRGRAAALLRHLERLPAGGFDESRRFRLQPHFAQRVDAGRVPEAELPYRVRRYAEGYRRVRGRRSTGGDRRG